MIVDILCFNYLFYSAILLPFFLSAATDYIDMIVLILEYASKLLTFSCIIYADISVMSLIYSLVNNDLPLDSLEATTGI